MVQPANSDTLSNLVEQENVSGCEYYLIYTQSNQLSQLSMPLANTVRYSFKPEWLGESNGDVSFTCNQLPSEA